MILIVANILYKIIEYYYYHQCMLNSGLCEIFFLLLFICIIYISKLLYLMLG